MPSTSADIEEENVWQSFAYDYLLIAYRALSAVREEGEPSQHDDSRLHLFTCCVFSFLSIDAVINDIWSSEEARRRDDKAQAGFDPWTDISSPGKFIKERPDKRIDLLAKAVSGKPFFSLGGEDGMRDLYLDYTDLRNALVHSAPDVTYVRTEILERRKDGEYTSTVSRDLERRPQNSVARRRRDGLRLQLAQWQQISDLGPRHALEVFKLALGLLHRISTVFQVSHFRGVFFDGKLRSFQNAYWQLPACHFDEEVGKHWLLSKQEDRG